VVLAKLEVVSSNAQESVVEQHIRRAAKRVLVEARRMNVRESAFGRNVTS
jgi:hypothetical protein